MENIDGYKRSGQAAAFAAPAPPPEAIRRFKGKPETGLMLGA
jgi:hypothetical protein